MKKISANSILSILLLASFYGQTQELEILGADTSQSSVFRARLPFSIRSTSPLLPEEGEDTYVYEENSDDDGIGDWGIEPESPSGGECYPDYNESYDSVVLTTPSFSINCQFENVSSLYTVQPNQDFDIEFNIQELRGSTTNGTLVAASLIMWQWSHSGSDNSNARIIGISEDGTQSVNDIDLGWYGEKNYTHLKAEVRDNQATFFVNGIESATVPYYPSSPVLVDVKANLARSNTLFENYVFKAYSID
tara:strand:+ start:448 stop:1194 length:747 start_codon:yes stop_codon:yes gene_type:complete